MSLQEFLDSGRLKRHLADAQVKGLSEDRRFTIAYNAALQAGRALLAAEGYRTAGQGHHHTVFQALRKVLNHEHHHVLDYLDDCRSKRNLADYLGTEVASEQEVSDLVRERHPRLIKLGS